MLPTQEAPIEIGLSIILEEVESTVMFPNSLSTIGRSTTQPKGVTDTRLLTYTRGMMPEGRWRDMGEEEDTGTAEADNK